MMIEDLGITKSEFQRAIELFKGINTVNLDAAWLLEASPADIGLFCLISSGNITGAVISSI